MKWNVFCIKFIHGRYVCIAIVYARMIADFVPSCVSISELAVKLETSTLLCDCGCSFAQVNMNYTSASSERNSIVLSRCGTVSFVFASLL